MWIACSANRRSAIGTAKLMMIGLATPTIDPLSGLNVGGRNGGVPVNGVGFCPAAVPSGITEGAASGSAAGGASGGTAAGSAGGGGASGSAGGGAANGSAGGGGATGSTGGGTAIGSTGIASTGSGGGAGSAGSGSASANGAAKTSPAVTPIAQNIEVNVRFVPRCDAQRHAAPARLLIKPSRRSSAPSVAQGQRSS